MKDNQKEQQEVIRNVQSALNLLDTYMQSTNQAFRNVLIAGVQTGGFSSLEVQVISLKRFMNALGYVEVYAGEDNEQMTRGFILKHPYVHKDCLPVSVSFNDAIYLHNIAFDEINNLPFVTIKKIPRGLIEDARHCKIVETVGLQVVKQTIKRNNKRGSVIRTTKEFVKFV